jgi:hypothetical protein
MVKDINPGNQDSNSNLIYANGTGPMSDGNGAGSHGTEL